MFFCFLIKLANTASNALFESFDNLPNESDNVFIKNKSDYEFKINELASKICDSLVGTENLKIDEETKITEQLINIIKIKKIFDFVEPNFIFMKKSYIEEKLLDFYKEINKCTDDMIKQTNLEAEKIQKQKLKDVQFTNDSYEIIKKEKEILKKKIGLINTHFESKKYEMKINIQVVIHILNKNNILLCKKDIKHIYIKLP